LLPLFYFCSSPEGQPYGRLWERDPSTGEWKIARTDVREYQQPTGFAILSDEELRNLRGPLINVPAPPQPSGPPPLTPPPDRVDTQTPPSLAQQPAGPIVEVYPMGPPTTIDELIIEQRSRAEQQRFRNWLIDEAQRLDPNFDPTLYDAHHIVPLTEYPELSGLRDRLSGWGIDLNDASINGVLAPRAPGAETGTVHSDTQRNEEYRDAIEKRFEGVTTRERAIEVLMAIRDELRNGTFILPKKG
jgi:hypothetical protein